MTIIFKVLYFHSQLFRIDSPELRRYEKQIQTAYLKKELTCQIKEKEAMKNEQKVKEYYDDLERMKIGDYGIKHEIEEQSQKNKLKFEYNNAILEQIQKNTEKQQSFKSQNRYTNIEPTNNCYSQNKVLKTNCSKIEMDELVKIKNDLKKKEHEEAKKLDK